VTADPRATDPLPTDPRTTDPRETLNRALDTAGLVVARITPDQASLPTPCESWNVGTLANHLINGLDRFRVAAVGETPDWSQPMPDVDGDWAGEFRVRSEALAAAWASVPDIGATRSTGLGDVPISFVVTQQIAEVAQHTWDLATATGQRDLPDEAVATEALAWARQALKPEFRGPESEGKAFGAEHQIADDAPAPDRLAAFFGRDPSFRAV
jgi:uncharacterized protein (TIGR03086 family)